MVSFLPLQITKRTASFYRYCTIIRLTFPPSLQNNLFCRVSPAKENSSAGRVLCPTSGRQQFLRRYAEKNRATGSKRRDSLSHKTCRALCLSILSCAGFRKRVWGFAPFHAAEKRCRWFRCNAVIPTTNTIGKTAAIRSPFCKSLCAKPETTPTDIGPMVPPRSPAKAKKANIAVPPAGQACEEILMVPGHRIPTEKPHSAHPAIPKRDDGDRAANK